MVSDAPRLQDEGDSTEYYEHYWAADGGGTDGVLMPRVALLLQRHIPRGARVLDLGCGDGRAVGPFLRERGCRYVGADVSERALARAASLGLDVEKIDDAGSLPFDTASFDAVVCHEVLEHLFAPHLAVAEARRVLRPGGVLIVTVPNVAYWRRRLELAAFGRWNPLGDAQSVARPWRDPHIRFFTRNALLQMLRECHFPQPMVGGHAGALLRDLPILGRRVGGLGGSMPYRVLERIVPSLFGLSLYGVARKPEGSA